MDKYGSEADGLFGDLVCKIQPPKDRGIFLKDVLDDAVDEKYYLSNKMLEYFSNRSANFNQGKVNVREEEGKASCLTSSMASCDISDNFIKCDTNLKKSANQDKANCFTAGGNSGGLHSDMTLIVASRERNPENPKSREIGLNTEQHLEPLFDGKTNCLTSVQKDNYVVFGGGYEQDNRAYLEDGKSGTLDVKPFRSKALLNSGRIRRLTPLECERLQTVSDGYTKNSLENHFQIFNFTGNKFTICPRFVKKKIVTNQFQVEKLNCVTSTIIDILETGQPNCQGQLLTALKNVSWNVVSENNNHPQKRVLCTIKDGKDMVHSLFQNELINQDLVVNFAIQKLENQDALECVISITKFSNYTETHYTPKQKDLSQIYSDIIEIQTESNFTEKLLNKRLVESSLKESKSYTILTLIKLIITQSIYKSLRNQNTLVRISSLIKLQGNSLELELSYIETENIVLTSDTMRYRMLGNGWTIEVVAHIFSYLPKEWFKQQIPSELT